MWTWLKQYQADLVRRGTASQVAARYVEVQSIGAPWLLPLGGMIVVTVVGELLAGPDAYWVKILAAMLLGLPAITGMIYAMSTYLIAASKADLQKRRTSSPDRPPS